MTKKKTFKNQEMYDLIILLSSLNETGKLAYAIARNTRKLKEECTEYIDIRSKLFEKYGDINKEENWAKIKPEYEDDYIKEIGDIPLIEHEVEIYTISEDDFISGSLTNNQMDDLMWMVNTDKDTQNEIKNDSNN